MILKNGGLVWSLIFQTLVNIIGCHHNDALPTFAHKT